MRSSREIIFDTIRTIILTLIFAFVIPTVLIISSPIFTYRWIIKSVAKYIRPDLIKMTTPLANTFAQKDSFENPNSTAVFNLVLEGFLDYEEFLKTFQEKVLLLRDPKNELCYPELQQYLVNWCGFKFWRQDSNFELKNHIKLLKKQTQDGVFSEEDLRKFIEIQIKKPYILTQSPWEITLIQNFKTDSEKDICTCLLFRSHHSLADGYSFIGVLQSLGDNPNLMSIRPTKQETPKNIFNIFSQILFPIKLLYCFSSLLPLCFRAEPLKIHPSQRATKIHADISQPILLNKLIKIKNLENVSVTSVLYSAVTGALRKLLLAKNIQIPDSVNWILPFPLPGHPGGLTNHFTIAPMILPVGEKDERKRLSNCHANYGVLKTSLTPIVCRLASLLYGSYLNCIGSRMPNSMGSGYLSYFPFTADSFKICGKKVVKWFVFTGFHATSAGVLVCITGSSDNLYATVVADDAVLSKDDCKFFLDMIVNEIDDMISTAENIPRNN